MLDTMLKKKSKFEIAKALLIEQLDANGFAEDMFGLAEQGGVSLDDLARARKELGLVAYFDAPGRPGWSFYQPENEPLRPAKKKWHTPRLIEVKYPHGEVKSIPDLHNWMTAVDLAPRLSDRAKRILTRLAGPLRLTPGRLAPYLDPLALDLSIESPTGDVDSTRRMIRRSLELAEKLGWIERTIR